MGTFRFATDSEKQPGEVGFLYWFEYGFEDPETGDFKRLARVNLFGLETFEEAVEEMKNALDEALKNPIIKREPFKL